MTKHLRSVLIVLVVLTTALTASACGSGSKPGGEGGSGQPSDVTAAQKVVDQYSAEPTRFPVDQPLATSLAPGQRLAFLQCAAPFCALLAQLYDQGAKLMGIPPVETVKTDPSADGIQSALSSIQAMHPAALLLPAVNLAAVGRNVKQLAAAGVPIVGAGVMGGAADGISAPVNGPANYEVGGQILADWAIVTGAKGANVVFYGNPEFDFTRVITKSFTTELAKNCPACTPRFVDIPATTIGSTAPSRVVSDLQAHPDTTIVIFSSLETATGLPAALKVAHLEPKIAGDAPVPANLQDMRTGGIQAAVGLDAGVLAFTQLDAAVRLATRQPLTDAEKAGDIPSQLITAANLPHDISHGFSAYPDFTTRFAKLWQKVSG